MIGLILGLMVVAILLWGFDAIVPTTESNRPIKILIWVVVAICVVYYIAGMLGFADLPLPRMRR